MVSLTTLIAASPCCSTELWRTRVHQTGGSPAHPPSPTVHSAAGADIAIVDSQRCYATTVGSADTGSNAVKPGGSLPLSARLQDSDKVRGTLAVLLARRCAWLSCTPCTVYGIQFALMAAHLSPFLFWHPCLFWQTDGLSAAVARRPAVAPEISSSKGVKPPLVALGASAFESQDPVGVSQRVHKASTVRPTAASAPHYLAAGLLLLKNCES